MTARRDLPLAAIARVHVLFQGYLGERVASTVVFVRDGDVRVIIDPGMTPSPDAILTPLRVLGESPEAITDAVFSRRHPGHTLHAALFPRARFHDERAIYQGDAWTRRAVEGSLVSPSVRLIATPGHTPRDITTLIGTPDGIAACTHLWRAADDDGAEPLTTDLVALRESRERVLALASLIIPAHGAPFTPGPETPR